MIKLGIAGLRGAADPQGQDCSLPLAILLRSLLHHSLGNLGNLLSFDGLNDIEIALTK